MQNLSYIAEPRNEKEKKAISHFRRLLNSFSQIPQTRTESQISKTLVTRKSNHFIITTKSSEEWYCGSSFTTGRSVSKQPITSQDIGKQACHQPKET